jgi:hypothetical protein
VALRAQRIIVSLLFGTLVVVLPYLLEKIPWNSEILQIVRDLSVSLLYPGYVVALFFVGGRVHEINFSLLAAAAFLFHSALIYVGISFASRHLKRNHTG